MLNRLRRQRRPVVANDMPAILFSGDGYEWWVAEMRELATAALAVELTFTDGGTRDATLRGAGFYGGQQLAGITVAFWEGDEEPPADALETVVYSSDITHIRIY